MRRASRAALVLLVVLPVVQLLLPARPSTAAEPPASSGSAGVLVVGVAGLRWDDLGPDTPSLNALAATGAVGALSVKALPRLTCPADGWLTLGAGARARAYATHSEPCGPSLAADPDDAARNAASRDGARLGALATARGGRVEVSGPGAALATSRSGTGSGPLGAPPGTPSAAPPGTPSATPGQPVVLLDAGTLAGTLGGDQSADEPADRRAALRRVDAVVARAVETRPPAVDLIVVGVSESVGSRAAHLHVAIATGPSFPRGALSSPSTRRAPYVQLIDVAPTVLGLLGTPVPATMDGQPWRVAGPAPSVTELVDLDRRAQGQREATVPFFALVYATTLIAFGLAVWRRRRSVVEGVALTSAAVLGASYLANLLPWWRYASPLLALLAVTLPIAVTVALAARALGRRTSAVMFPAGVVCAFVAVVLLADLVTGARLQLDSIGGYSPLVAGRFAGIGNVAFGVLAAAVLLATAALTRRAAAVVVVAVATVLVDGAPPWGSDVGGVLALVPAFALLILLRAGRRRSVLRLGVAALAGVAVVAAFGLADWSRPAPERTHLGRFVQDVVDGSAGELLRRKADAIFGLLFLNPATALIPGVVAAVVYLVLRPPDPLRRAFEQAPAWRHGLQALGVACLLGFALNDSGAAVPALAAAVAVPATAAVAARAVAGRSETRDRAVTGPGASPPGQGTVPVA